MENKVQEEEKKESQLIPSQSQLIWKYTKEDNFLPFCMFTNLVGEMSEKQAQKEFDPNQMKHDKLTLQMVKN